MESRKPVIGYLLKTFPKLSETFILNEMLELERQGITLRVFSLRRSQDQRHHPAVEQLKAPVTYLPSLLPTWHREEETRLLNCLTWWGQRDCAAFVETLQFYCDRPEDRRFNEFLQGCYLAELVEQLGITHLHVHFANIPAATAEIAQQLCHVPFSLTAHAKDIYLTKPEALNRRLQAAEFTLTCTDYNRRYLMDIAGADCPIHLAYHGIDLSRFRATATAAAIAPSDLSDSLVAAIEPASPAPAPLQILSVGRFCEKKGFPYLLKACHLLHQAGVDFHCRIVGYGPLRAALETQICDLNLSDRIVIVGQLTQDQVIAEYRRAEVFVLPCQVTADGDRDGIPNVLLEAMAIGLPVVSTAISGITELVQSGQNGLLVAEKDAA
ncbi:MAG: glycosyltransferase, partial [Cyanobacteria bacterium P01_C01_bin.70]